MHTYVCVCVHLHSGSGHQLRFRPGKTVYSLTCRWQNTGPPSRPDCCFMCATVKKFRTHAAAVVLARGAGATAAVPAAAAVVVPAVVPAACTFPVAGLPAAAAAAATPPPPLSLVFYLLLPFPSSSTSSLRLFPRVYQLFGGFFFLPFGGITIKLLSRIQSRSPRVG